MTSFDNLKLLIAALKNIGLLERIFGWRKIKNLLIDAAMDISANEAKLSQQSDRIYELTTERDLLLQSNQSNLETRDKAKVELDHLKIAFSYLQKENERLQRENITYNTTEESRREKYESSMASLEKIENRIQTERSDEIEQRRVKEVERLANLKQTWLNHEINVKSSIRSIAQRHTIDYKEKVPFKGAPDNTLFICDEYVVFDAKSPAGDDLRNFPTYIKDQAERAHKYAKQSDVKPDIFFVVPSNTLEVLKNSVYNFSEYSVYIVSIDTLEPLIINLKKIEEYEFAKELTPDDRSNICRILGRFAHLSKRRIQIDNFFAKQFIELAYKAESSLPSDILENVIEFERSEKLNPPQEKRAKSILTNELEKEMNQIKQDADGKGITMDESELSNKINQHPLYKDKNE